MDSGAQTMRNLRVLRYCLIAVCGVVCAAPAVAQPEPPVRTQLEVAQYLMVNDYLVAADRMSHAVLQPDGNLCVFRGDRPQRARSAPLWCSGSARSKGDYYAIFGADANLCINRGKAPAASGRDTNRDTRVTSVSSVWCWGDKSVVGGHYVLRVDGAALVALEMLALPSVSAQRPLRQLWASRKLNKLSGFTGAR